jgi:hypothetical protein
VTFAALWFAGIVLAGLVAIFDVDVKEEGK